MTAPLAGKRIGLLTASASRLGGGVFEAVVAQAGMIRTLGGEAIVIALADQQSAADRHRFGPSEVRLARVVGPRQVGFAPALAGILRAAQLDCLHLHGIWMYPSAAAARWAQSSGRPYLISPHGMLDPWIVARGRWKKALAQIGYERRSWAAARGFHALTGREAEDIGRATGRRGALVTPNAAPLAGPAPSAPRGQDYLYIGRIHPKKNLRVLLAAWSALNQADRLPASALLTVAGWGEAHDVAEFERALGEAPGSVRFVGPVYGADKRALLETARCVVLPSLSEGLPQAVLEGWAAGTPVLMSSECNLAEGFAAGAARDCGMDAGSVGAALAEMAMLPEREWLAMARAAHALATGPFGAATIAARWGETYAALMETPR